jgi:hypothetical protein
MDIEGLCRRVTFGIKHQQDEAKRQGVNKGLCCHGSICALLCAMSSRLVCAWLVLVGIVIQLVVLLSRLVSPLRKKESKHTLCRGRGW